MVAKHNLSFNVSKTKELVINFRKRSGVHTSVRINGGDLKLR